MSDTSHDSDLQVIFRGVLLAQSRGAYTLAESHALAEAFKSVAPPKSASEASEASEDALPDTKPVLERSSS